MSEHTPSVFASGYAHHCLRKVCGTKIVYDLDVALHQTGDLLPGRPIHRLLTEMEVLPRIQRNRFDVACRATTCRSRPQAKCQSPQLDGSHIRCRNLDRPSLCHALKLRMDFDPCFSS